MPASGASARAPRAKKKKRTARKKVARKPKAPLSPAERALRRKAGRIVRGLAREYPAADCALNHDSAFQLLIATILSAQCTDRRVNMVTPALFARYPTAVELADADPDDVERMIHSTGFFRNKTRSILGASQRIRDDFGGEVPDTMKELLTLPGVARKTANVILGTWFGKNEGVVVDTHVSRISHRLGLAPKATPVRIERRLMSLLPRPQWTLFSHRVILHGRAVCSARKPQCRECSLEAMCPRIGVDPGPGSPGKPPARRRRARRTP